MTTSPAGGGKASRNNMNKVSIAELEKIYEILCRVSDEAFSGDTAECADRGFEDVCCVLGVDLPEFYMNKIALEDDYAVCHQTSWCYEGL